MNVEVAEEGATKIFRFTLEELFVEVENNDLSCLHQRVFHL